MKKNRFEVIKNGNVVCLKVIATSEAMADSFFEMFESLGTQAVKIDLEKNGEKEMKDPTTLAEWQEAVDLAYICLQIESAKAYGLITHNQDFNLKRCEELLRDGLELGFRPDPDAFERWIENSRQALEQRRSQDEEKQL